MVEGEVEGPSDYDPTALARIIEEGGHNPTKYDDGTIIAKNRGNGD